MVNSHDNLYGVRVASSVKHNKFFNKAIELAEFGEHRVRVGAIAVARGKLQAGAFNVMRNSTLVELTGRTFHAEQLCLSQIGSLRISLYVARINRNGGVMPSLPCRSCLAHLKDYNIKEVVFWTGTKLVRITPTNLL